MPNQIPDIPFPHDSTIILALVLLTLGLMLGGLMSKYKILSLMAIGSIWALLVEFQNDPMLVVTLASLMLFNGYHALFGGKYE